MSTPNFQKWEKLDLWTMEQSSWLLAGLEPQPSHRSPQSVIELQEILVNALEANTLQTHNRWVVLPGYEKHAQLWPREVIEYALQRRLNIPKELLDRYDYLSPHPKKNEAPQNHHLSDPFKRFPQVDGEIITVPALMERWDVPKRHLERLAIEKLLNPYMNDHQLSIRREDWKGETFQYPPAYANSEKKSHWQTGPKTVFVYTPEGAKELPDEAYYQLPEVLMYEKNHSDTLPKSGQQSPVTSSRPSNKREVELKETTGLYRTLGLLAKIYSLSDKKLQHSDGKPNIDAIVQQLLDEVEILKEDNPDINTHGTGKSSAHKFISQGISLLEK